MATTKFLTDISIPGLVTGNQIQSTATGVSPFIVASTMMVNNLNAHYLNGQTATSNNTASTIVSRDASGNFAANIITAGLFAGPGTNLTGTAASLTAGNATKLSTPRLINGTSFDGSADITTSYWGTSRTITIGNTGKSVNGSANMSWTLAEIGAMAAPSGTTNAMPKFTSANTIGNSRLDDDGTSFIFKGVAATDGTTVGSELMTTASGTNWTGSNLVSPGYTHTAGSTANLTSTATLAANQSYEITISVTAVGFVGTVSVYYNSVLLYSIQEDSGTAILGLRSAGSALPLIITPTSDFDGRIQISVKQVTAPIAPMDIHKNSGGNTVSETRYGASIGNSQFWGLTAGRYAENTTRCIGVGAYTMVNLMGPASYDNIAMGVNALYQAYDTSVNVVIGSYSLYTMTQGTGNVVVGHNCIGSSIGSNYNTAVGNGALGNLNNSILSSVSENAALGYRAGHHISGGVSALSNSFSSIFIGAYSRALANGQTNQIVIGHTATGNGSNTVTIGNGSIVSNHFFGTMNVPGTGTFVNTQIGYNNTQGVFHSTLPFKFQNYGAAQKGYFGGLLVSYGWADETLIPADGIFSRGNIASAGDVIAFSTSDVRLKDNIKPIENALDKVMKLSGNTFTWNDKQDSYKGDDIGVIAQEVEEVLPEIVTTRDNGYKAVKYEKMVALLIEAIKEQQVEINELKAKIDGLTK
jgi:hypothetical protein